jgi:hypothetical protein
VSKLRCANPHSYVGEQVPPRFGMDDLNDAHFTAWARTPLYRKGAPSLDSRHRQPVDLVVEALPVITPDVAAVLARIVRSLRELPEREA